jgi:transposase-like protein
MTLSGSQRYLCMHCHCKYTPEPKRHGYPDNMRKQAVQMYVDGINLRRIARHFGIHHRTVSLWVQASAASLPEAPVPKEVKTAEMDELFTFIGKKKTGSTSSHS